MKKRTFLFNVLSITVLFLAACNLPSSNNGNETAGTAAAETVEALLASATPLPIVNVASSTPLPLVSATNTSIPLPVSTNTPLATATSNCNVMQFVADVTFPDNTVVTPGQVFVKTWRIKNVGTCAWTPSYAVVFSSGNAMNGPSTQALAGNVNPGQTLDVSISLTAPTPAGDYRGDWKIRDASGVLFGAFYVQIKSQIAVAATNTTAPAFAVTGVTYNVSGTCGNFHVSANITTNGAGTVHFFWQANGSDDFEGTYGSTLNFGAAGTLTTPTIDWSISANGSHYLRVYIDDPNHQFIGQSSNMVCP